MITTEMLLKDWQITIDVLRFLIRNEIQLKLQQKCVFLYVDNQTFGDPINLLGDVVNDFPNQDEFGDVDPKCKQYLQQNDTASQATSVNQTATGSGNIQISTSDGANITIHPQHDGLTIDQLWQRTRDEMQRNAEEKVRIKNNMEDSMSELRAQNNQYQKQIETLQDELDELTAKLIDSGHDQIPSLESTMKNEVGGVELLNQILGDLEPEMKKYTYKARHSRTKTIALELLRKELYLGLLENPELIDVENHPYVVIVRHITSRQFAFYLTETKSDPREHDIEIVSWLDKTLNNYKTTGDRFCKVRSGRYATHTRNGNLWWFIFGTEIHED